KSSIITINRHLRILKIYLIYILIFTYRLQHAKNYATLLNTSVGTKEMVHRLFKNIVPRTNLKNVRLDLLKYYTTLFAIRHLLDGGIDLRFSISNVGFMNLS